MVHCNSDTLLTPLYSGLAFTCRLIVTCLFSSGFCDSDHPSLPASGTSTEGWEPTVALVKQQWWKLPSDSLFMIGFEKKGKTQTFACFPAEVCNLNSSRKLFTMRADLKWYFKVKVSPKLRDFETFESAFKAFVFYSAEKVIFYGCGILKMLQEEVWGDIPGKHLMKWAVNLQSLTCCFIQHLNPVQPSWDRVLDQTDFKVRVFSFCLFLSISGCFDILCQNFFILQTHLSSLPPPLTLAYNAIFVSMQLYKTLCLSFSVSLLFFLLQQPQK